jgi:hypothetical protein
MADRDLRRTSFNGMGMPFEAMTDLYRAKYGLPLDGENHERFIATKVPYRKNKDYRPRFRNYSFGYPVREFLIIIKFIFWIICRLTKKIIIQDIGIIW